MGVLARSSSDSIVDGIGRLIPCSSPLVSEVWVVREACLLVRARAWQRAITKSDSEVVIDLCSSDHEPRGEIEALIVDIRTIPLPF